MKQKMNRLVTIAFLATLVASSAGCWNVRYTTSAERNASFDPYDKAQIAGEPARDFLGVRSASIICNVKFSITPSANQDEVGTLNLMPQKPEGPGFGFATAIDRRGYFLTAAHCVPDENLCLMLVDGKKPQIERPRIVWRGDATQGQPDLAIICVSSPLQRSFEWAVQFKPRDVVLGSGFNLDFKKPAGFNFSYGYFAGKILMLSPRAKGVPSETIIFHDAPGHRGDSGGPLVTLDGKLLGINTAVQEDLLKFGRLSGLHGLASRPDLEWLRQTIDEDFARHSSAAAAPSN